VHFHLVPIVAFRLFHCGDSWELLAGSLHHDPDLFREREIELSVARQKLKVPEPQDLLF
jgi:hypothetical protein